MHNEDYSNINPVVDQLLADHIVSDFPKIATFTKELLKFLEKDHLSAYYLNSLDRNRDIDAAESQFLTELQKEIGSPIPRQFAADPRTFYKKVTDLYRSRGTPDSIEAFFRFLYNDDVEIYFPKDDMFIPSDGRWFSTSTNTIADPSTTTPLFTYTLSSDTNTISGQDDDGRNLLYDNPIVFVDGTRRTDFTATTTVNENTNTLDYSLIFNSELTTGSVVEVYTSGAFTTNDGFTSDDKKLQDSFFYQKFSYVLRTGTNSDLWKNAFNRLVHPAGFIFFGEIQLFLNSLGQTAPLSQPGFQIGGLPVPIVIPSFQVIEGTYIKRKQDASVFSSDTEIVSNIIVEPLINVQPNPIGAQEWFEDLKFKYSSPISSFGHFTFQDAINKNIKFNIESTIELN